MAQFKFEFTCDGVKDKLDAHLLGNCIETFVHNNWGIYDSFKIDNIYPITEKEVKDV